MKKLLTFFLFLLRLCIDVKDIRYVINFDFSSNIEDYIHRIGRTGRAGTKGTSITFFTTDNSKNARDLVKILREANQEVPPELDQMVSWLLLFIERTTNLGIIGIILKWWR